MTFMAPHQELIDWVNLKLELVIIHGSEEQI